MSTKKVILREYQSVSQVCDAAEKGNKTYGTKDASYGGSDEFYRGRAPLTAVRAPQWSGDMNVGQAINAARYGTWSPEYAPEIREMFNDLVPRLRSALSFDFERRLDYAGDQVDIQSYVDGMPEQFHNWFPTEMETKKGVVTLLLGVGIRGCTICSEAACSAAPAIMAEDVFVRGQAVLGLVRALKLLGYELEVWTEYTVAGYGSSPKLYTQLVRVQAAGAVTDESSLEFACGHPGWTRKVLMRAQESETAEIRRSFGFAGRMLDPPSKYGLGYGSVMPPQMKEYVGADIVVDLGSDWFDRGFYDGFDRIGVTPEDVLKWTIKQLRDCGVLNEEKAAKVLQESGIQ